MENKSPMDQAQEQEFNRLHSIIRGLCPGNEAAVYWYEVAHAAMSGHALARAHVEELLGHPIRNMGDTYMVCSAASMVMSDSASFAIAQSAVPGTEANINRAVSPYLGNRIAKVRESAGLTQGELAQKTHIPLPMLQKMEYMPTTTLSNAAYLSVIAEALETSVDALISRN